MKESRLHGEEISVAVSPIHDSAKIGVKCYGMLGHAEAKVGRVSPSFDCDLSQRASVLAGGGKNSRDAFQRAEIGVGEGVISFDGGVARAVFIQRPKLAGGFNVAGRLGIDQNSVEAKGLLGTDVFHLQAADVELER